MVNLHTSPALLRSWSSSSVMRGIVTCQNPSLSLNLCCMSFLSHYFIPFLVMVFIIELHRGCGAGTYFHRTTICGNDIGGSWLLRSQRKRQSDLSLRSFWSMRSTLINPGIGPSFSRLRASTKTYSKRKAGKEKPILSSILSIDWLCVCVSLQTSHYLERIITYLVYNRSHFWS